jgi:hypothetical protein
LIYNRKWKRSPKRAELAFESAQKSFSKQWSVKRIFSSIKKSFGGILPNCLHALFSEMLAAKFAVRSSFSAIFSSTE